MNEKDTLQTNRDSAFVTPGDDLVQARARTRRIPKANPDDPPVHRPPQGPQGPLPGPNYLGLPGRTAIVQGQVFLVGLILIAQLWLITDALFELLSGRHSSLLWLALVSFLGFVLALVISFWPRRRIEGP